MKIHNSYLHNNVCQCHTRSGIPGRIIQWHRRILGHKTHSLRFRYTDAGIVLRPNIVAFSLCSLQFPQFFFVSFYSPIRLFSVISPFRFPYFSFSFLPFSIQKYFPSLSSVALLFPLPSFSFSFHAFFSSSSSLILFPHRPSSPCYYLFLQGFLIAS